MSVTVRPEMSVSLLTPSGGDAPMARRVFTDAGLVANICNDIESVCTLVRTGEAGVLVVAEEALAGRAREQFLQAIDEQPAWSDVPIIFLTGEGELSGNMRRALTNLTMKANVTLLERPVRIVTLVTALRSALRARERQLEVRDNLAERLEAERTLRESEARLRRAVSAAPYPLMLHAEDGEILQLSDAWTHLSGYDPHG